MKYYFALGVVMALAAAFFVPPLVQFFFPKYLPSVFLFELFLITLPIQGISWVELSVLTALREEKLMAKRIFITFPLRTAALAALLPVMGLFAVAVEYIGGDLLKVIFQYRQMVKKYSSLKLSLGSFIRFDREDKIIFMRGLAEVRTLLYKFLHRKPFLRSKK